MATIADISEFDDGVASANIPKTVKGDRKAVNKSRTFSNRFGSSRGKSVGQNRRKPDAYPTPTAPFHAKKVVVPKEVLFSEDKFEDIKTIHPYIIKNITTGAFQFTGMTTVQKMAIPVIIDGEDALIKAQTGSGKTLAFIIPIVHKLQELDPPVKRDGGCYGIIICPTRELAMQTYTILCAICKSFINIIPGNITGGEKRKSEKARLRKGINILVSTPGRLLDHLEKTTAVQLQNLKYLVLDEADRLIDQGYEEKVTAIVKILHEKVPHPVQGVLCSATLKPGIERLANLSLKNPKFIDVSSDHQSHQVCATLPEKLVQYYCVVEPRLRLVYLAATVLWKCRQKRNKMIVFLPTQDSVDFTFTLFNAVFSRFCDSDAEDDGEAVSGPVDFFRLHGEMSQVDRSEVFKRFQSTKTGCMFCTDVAARGVDLPAVRWVVQFSCPYDTPTYVHRVGRTARAGNHGYSLLLLLPSEIHYVNVLATERIALTAIKAETLLQHVGGKTRTKANDFNLQPSLEMQHEFEQFVNDDREVLETARKAFTSYVQFYASYKEKDLFAVKRLHLGHIAKSFALRDRPGSIASILHSNKEISAQSDRRLNGNRRMQYKSAQMRPSRANGDSRRPPHQGGQVFGVDQAQKRKLPMQSAGVGGVDAAAKRRFFGAGSHDVPTTFGVHKPLAMLNKSGTKAKAGGYAPPRQNDLTKMSEFDCGDVL